MSLDKSIRIEGYAATDIENAAMAHLAPRYVWEFTISKIRVVSFFSPRTAWKWRKLDWDGEAFLVPFLSTSRFAPLQLVASSLGNTGSATEMKIFEKKKPSSRTNSFKDKHFKTRSYPCCPCFCIFSTPAKNLFCAYDLAYHHDLHLADDGPAVENGRMRAPESPGLGITVKEELLGKPLFSC